MRWSSSGRNDERYLRGCPYVLLFAMVVGGCGEEATGLDSGEEPIAHDVGASVDLGGLDALGPSGLDAEPTDLDQVDAEAEDAASPDAQVADAETEDAGAADAEAADAGAADADPEDVSPAPTDLGTSPFDSGTPDLGASSGCGDGVIQTDEGCDDGNNTDGDGCTQDCLIDVPFNCTGAPSTCVLGPNIGPLAAGGTVQVTGGPLSVGGSFFYRMRLLQRLIVAGHLSAPSGSTADLDLVLAADLSAQGFGAVFSSTEIGNEHFTTQALDPGDYAVLVLAHEAGGPASSYDLLLQGIVPLVCGNGIFEAPEQCDDGNSTAGDGCSATCQLELGPVWTCNPTYYGTGDGCDCGCGRIDPDCADATVASCLWCQNSGSCNEGFSCPGAIVAVNNAVCAPSECGNGLVEAQEACDDGNTVNGDGCNRDCEVEPTPTWNCLPHMYGANGDCDCGCGLPDPDCADALVASCDSCSLCYASDCRDTIEPNNNAFCLYPP